MDSDYLAKIKECPDCKRRMLRLYAMQSRGLRNGMAPTISDDESWAQLKDDHDVGCYWWQTRGHRRVFNKGEGYEEQIPVSEIRPRQQPGQL